MKLFVLGLGAMAAGIDAGTDLEEVDGALVCWLIKLIAYVKESN